MSATQCLVLSKHAIARFVERQVKNCGVAPSDPEACIRRLLREAVMEQVPQWLLEERQRKHGTRNWFMVAHGWRFVCKPANERGVVLIVTIERQVYSEN